MEIVETAPHNYSHKAIYAGVGAHLFAIACQISIDAGCDGVVAFTSKSDLVGYYMDRYFLLCKRQQIDRRTGWQALQMDRNDRKV